MPISSKSCALGLYFATDDKDRDIVKRFPTIAFLDGEPVQLSEEEKASVEKSRTILPVDPKTHFFDNDTSKQLAQEFIAK